MLTTTFARLKEAKACANGYKKLAENLGGVERYGRDTPITFQQIYESNGYVDTLWAIKAASDDMERLIVCRKLVVRTLRKAIKNFIVDPAYYETQRKALEVINAVEGLCETPGYPETIFTASMNKGIKRHRSIGEALSDLFDSTNYRWAPYSCLIDFIEKFVKPEYCTNWDNLLELCGQVKYSFLNQNEYENIFVGVVCPDAVRKPKSPTAGTVTWYGTEDIVFVPPPPPAPGAAAVPTDAPCKTFEFRAELTLEQYANTVYNAAIYDVLALVCEGMYVLDPLGMGYPQNGRIINQVAIEGLIKPV